MRTRQDVERRLRGEIEQAFLRQSKDIFAELYLYFCPSTLESDGGFLFCAAKPRNPCYELADPRRYPRNATQEQAYSMYIDQVMRLPILSIR